MHRTRTTTRPGFTLIEMLVVISIIIILAAITIQVAGAIFNTARRARTSALLAKIEASIKGRQSNFSGLNLEKFEDLAHKRFDRPENNEFISSREAKLLAHKIAFKRYFPQTWQELNDTLRVMHQPDPTDDPAEFDARWAIITGKLGHDPLLAPTTPFSGSVESSEVLLFALTQDELLGVAPVDADEFSESEIGDLDNDGIKEFIDGWGQPLRFYRWPTRLIRPGGVNFANTPPEVPIKPQQYSAAQTHISSLPALLTNRSGQRNQEESLRDRDDPLLTMDDTVSDPNLWENNPDDPGWTLHTPFTYHTPLVVSAGGDGILGLLEPTNVTNFGYLAAYPQEAEARNAMDDNMTNQNLRAGGR